MAIQMKLKFYDFSYTHNWDDIEYIQRFIFLNLYINK
jgi:hypothetical protein